MKRHSIILCVIFFLACFSASAAQELVRVKCNNITMNVPSANVRCFQIDGNIPLAAEPSQADLANAQIAGTYVYFSDYEKIKTEIEPQVNLYLIDDMTRTSFGFLDIAIKLQDDLTNLSAGYGNIADISKESSFMPVQAKERTFAAFPEILTFQEGSGLRTVVSFTDSILASGNESNLYYSFQGISKDGRYYISAVFPLMSLSLNNMNAADIDWSKIDGSDFQPSLAQLDYYIRSIVIE